MSSRDAALYDRIGRTYNSTRRPDGRIALAITDALGPAESVVNVGAGSGAYEPTDRAVVAVEPSSAMLAQRPADAAPGVRAVAEALPFADESFDAALAILTLHHWINWRAGVRELARVSRERAVVLSWESEVGGRFWLLRYFPEILACDIPRFPLSSAIASEIGGRGIIVSVPVPRDCNDGFLGAYWARPEAYLDPLVRSGMSTFSQIDPAAVESGLRQLADDLASGAWRERFGAQVAGDEIDLGYRLIIGEKR